jgi:hypothetical protein
MLYFLLFFVQILLVVLAKDQPVISEDFSLFLIEYDSNGVITNNETLAFDATLRRSNMYAVGTLVQGAMQQIKRCDMIPHDGWFSTAGGPDASSPQGWVCTNVTLPVASEIPYHCQYGNFWGFPPMTYNGEEDVDGVVCDAWQYMSGGYKYGVWVTGDGTVPVRTAKLTGQTWSMDFFDWVAGSPAEQAYEPVVGSPCPPATPQTDDDGAGSGAGQRLGFGYSYSELVSRADKR